MTDARKISAKLEEHNAERKRNDALALHLKGWSYQAIATELGWDAPSSAQRAVKAALDSRVMPEREQMRKAYLEKFDRIERAVWPDFLAGSAAHGKVLLEAMRDRAKMFGLDDPTQVQVDLAPMREMFATMLPVDEPEDAELVEDAEEVPPDDDGA